MSHKTNEQQVWDFSKITLTPVVEKSQVKALQNLMDSVKCLVRTWGCGTKKYMSFEGLYVRGTGEL